MRALILSAGFVLASCGAKNNSAQIGGEISEAPISVGALGGTFIDTGTDRPPAIIIPGSGPVDKDGNMDGMRSNAYKFLAEGLARRGISTVRVDKRGMYSSADAGDPNAVSIAEYSKDYAKWIDHLREISGQDCVYLIGHSEGGLMASAAAQGRGDVCGLILIAAPARKIGDILRTQLTENPANAPILEDALRSIDRLEAGEKVDVSGMHAALKGLFAPQVQDFLMDLMAADPVTILEGANKRTLVIQGDNDLQITTDDAKRLAATGAELVIVEKMNHVLKPASRNRLINMRKYDSPNLDIDSAVIDAIDGFVE